MSKLKKDWNLLTDKEHRIIVNKGTEYPFSGDDTSFKGNGVFVCRRCEHPLYENEDKFDSGCGWPSFDDNVTGNVKRIRDADGMRVEIVCSNCDGHLGHVFEGEKLTSKNVRHCVNSLSIRFVSSQREG